MIKKLNLLNVFLLSLTKKVEMFIHFLSILFIYIYIYTYFFKSVLISFLQFCEEFEMRASERGWT